MIEVRFMHVHDQKAGFEITGHAGYAAFGSDIVCAAVSVLAINTVNSLEELANIHPLIEDDSENGGYLHVELKITDLSNHRAQLLLASFELGISSVVGNYQKYIKIVK